MASSTALVVKPMTKTIITSTFINNNNKGMLCKILLIIIIVIATIFYVIDSSGIHINLPAQMHFKFIHLHNTRGDADDPELDGGWNWQIEYDHQIRYHESNKNKTGHQKDGTLLWSSSDNNDNLYFVNTIGCKMPSFNIMDEHVRKFVYNAEEVRCKASLTKSSNNFIWIALNHTEILKQYNVSMIENLHCSYQPFIRKTDKLNVFLKNKIIYFKYGDIMKITDEFIKVICKYNDHPIYTDYHYFIQLKNGNISSSTNNNNNNNNNNNKTIKKNLPNIMIIGLDSVSRLNFHRQMNITVDILLNKLKAIEFFGYNKVDDNTYPNLVPVLTGLDENELIDACLRGTIMNNNTYDNCHFIWDDYKAIGYTTVFAEDMAILGLFNYLKRGFVRQPTDYNIRPVMIEMERNIAAMKKGNVHLCLGGRKPVDIILDYIKKLINLQNSLTAVPYFSFFWTTSYTHDFLNYPQLIDAEFSNFLNNLTDGTLNNTFLFLMSDHGIRWGDFRNTYQGMMEERQPFLFMIPPIWFRENYTMAMYNLLKNRHKLTTHYDLYETLHDLLKLSNLKNDNIRERTKELRVTEPMPRGISLLLPIPKDRTCLLAGIAAHWCTCHEKKDISTGDKRVLRVAHFIVQKINDIIKIYPQCRKISLNLIAQATIGSSNDAIISTNNNKTKISYFVDITVRLQTKPGYADFESTVRIHNGNGDLELTGSISRTNLYGKQSQCVDDYKVKLYCFCDSFI